MNTQNTAMVLETGIASELVNIAIEQIVTIEGLNKRFDMGELKEFAEGIKCNGVQQPILVRANGDKYELIAGHRRVEACKLIGLLSIPAIVKNLTLVQAVMSNGIENLSRKDLNPIEEADTLWAMALASGVKGKPCSARELGRQIGRNNVSVAARMKLATASEMMRTAIRQGKLDTGRADRLIKDGKDEPGAIAEAMKEHAIAKVEGGLKRTDTINGVTPKVEAPAAKSLTVTDEVPFNEETGEVIYETIDEDEAAAMAIAKIAGTSVEKESVTPTTVPESMDIPSAAPATTAPATPTVTIVPAKEAPKVDNGKPVVREPKAVHMDTMRALLTCVGELLRDEPSDSARYPFLQGVQYGYQVMCGLDTDANIPEEWEEGI
jgi:ParB/RepB/Spo0J family partition protein